MRINHSTKALALGALAFVLYWAFPSTNAQEHPPTASTGEVRNKDVAPDGGSGKNWTSYNGDYSGQRYNSLSGINTTNVSRLRIAWIFQAENSSRLEVPQHLHFRNWWRMLIPAFHKAPFGLYFERRISSQIILCLKQASQA
jgi:glucose dehydrogenase